MYSMNSIAGLKAGTATAPPTTKLMLPHEMLADGHSTLLIPSSPVFYSTNNSSSNQSFQNTFSSFASVAAPDFRSNPLTHSSSLPVATPTPALNHSSVPEVLKEPQQQQPPKTEEHKELVPNGDAKGEGEPQEEEPEIDIVISNVVCSFSVRCHLNLRQIALNGFNVEFRRENAMVTMKLRRPYTTASIWSSGRITCTGATSEDQAKIAARKYARCLQKLGFRVRFHNFRIVNVLGTSSMPWGIKITPFSERYRKEASYEPELHPGVTYKLKEPKATLKIFSTGSITVTAANVAFVQQAIEHIYPLVYEFRKKRSPEEEKIIRNHQTYAVSSTANTTERDFNPDELIEVDEDFVEQSSSEEETVETAATGTKAGTAGTTLAKKNSVVSKRQSIWGTGRVAAKKRRKQHVRPAGKAANDPDDDMIQVSDEDNELSDEDL